MNTSQMAQEIERKLSNAVHTFVRGNYDYQLCSGQANAPHFDTLHQPLLDLIPEIEKLSKQIQEEIRQARESN